MNRQLVTLSRVVIHPTFRGAGLASAFIHQSCRSCSFPWIETLAQMGHINPFFEKAGFVRVGVSRNKGVRSISQHSAIYGNKLRTHVRKRLVSKETHEKSRYAEPVYYIFDNRSQTNDKEAAGHEEDEHKTNSEEEAGQQDDRNDIGRQK